VTKYYLQVYYHTPSTSEEEVWVDVNTLGLHPDTAQQLADLGIIEIRQGYISARQVKRLQKLLRLRSNLGVNLPGAAIILNLLEQVERLQEEVEQLKRR
jgi:MerR family transcriptional regulator/heat shock protein HspR